MHMLDTQLKQLNKKFEHLSKRVDAHDLRFDVLDEKIDLLAQAVAKHEQRFDNFDEKFDLLAQTAINHSQRLANIEENMATKEDIKGLIGIIDHWGKSIQDIKVDHTFSVGWLTRMQEQLGWHEQDIKKLKLMLNLA